MKTLRFCVCALLLLSLPRPAYAQSDFWDWIESFSGPGPFHGSFHSVNSRLLCTESTGGTHTVNWWCGDDTRPNIRTVLSAEVAWPDSDSNPRFADAVSELQNNGKVRATRFVVNYSYRFHPMIDLGVGAGVLVFSGDDFRNQSHPVVSPLTLTFTPLGFLHGDGNVARWGRLIRIKYAERYVMGDIRAQDFNSLKSTYFKSGEWNTNISVMVDFWPFVDRRKRP